MNFKKTNASILKQKQNELIDNFILDTENISRIMKTYTNKIKQFHSYSIGNLILANYQLIKRTGEGIELLAPYKKWNTINRNVCKGEKCLYILAPIFKEIKDDDGEVIEKKVWFKKVPVFDLSQTEGENFEEDLTENHTNLSFKEIKDKITDIPILETNKQITKGLTDGKTIWISKHLSDSQKICVLFHELAHYYLHFDENRKELSSATKELEAETISFMICSALGVVNHEAGAYITSWAGNNSSDMIKGKGNKLIKTACNLLDIYNLNDDVLEVLE